MKEIENLLKADESGYSTMRSIESELTAKLMTTMQSEDCDREGPLKPQAANYVQTSNRSYLGSAA
jgi:hypothetical protein